MRLKSFFLVMLCIFAVTAAFTETVSVSPVAALRDDASSIVYYLHHQSSSVYSTELLVILQGSDCNSVENIKAIPRLRGAYPDCDMVTIEKYGVTKDLPYSDSPEREDCPPGYLDNDTPDLRACDADRVVRALIAKYGYRKVIVIGGSEGALVANMFAARADYVTATVLFGGGGRFFYDDVITTLRSMRWTPEETAKNVEGFGQFRDYIREPRSVSGVDVQSRISLVAHDAFH
jgi:pimeloyl-ACP methyl ester carboxylesterase